MYDKTNTMVEKYVRLGQDSCKDVITSAKCAVGMTDGFKVDVGVRQGQLCVLPGLWWS